jgi:hypothetical protein
MADATAKTQIDESTALAQTLQQMLDAGASADALIKFAADNGVALDPKLTQQMVDYGKGARFLPGVIDQQPTAELPQVPSPADTTPLGAAIAGAGDVLAAEPSLGLDPENRAALENLGVLGKYLYAPLGDIGAAAYTTAQAGLMGAAQGTGQLLENIGVLPAIEALTSVKQTPTSFAEQALGIADFATMKYPFATVPEFPSRATPTLPRIAEVAEPITPPPAPRLARPSAAPEVVEAPKPVATPEVSVTPAPVAAAEAVPTIPVTQENVARAARTLENMAAPVEEAAPVVDRAGNINVTKLETTDDVKRLLDEVAATNDAFVEARRGVMPIEEINRLADKVDLEDIIGRKIGQPLNAEQTTAARRAVVASAEDLFATAREYMATGDQNLRAKALEAVMRQAAFQEQLAGATAELGRAMRSLREVQGSDRSRAVEMAIGQYTDITDPAAIDEFLRKIGTLNSPEAVSKFVGEATKPGFGDKISEFWINGLLAGPTTHAVNVTSNTLFSFMSLPEKALASGIGKVLRSEDRITSGEVKARMVGMLQGAKDGLRLFAEAIRTGEARSAKTAVEQQKKAIGGITGEVIRVPSRLLTAEDELFKAINSQGELAAQAYAQAAKEAGGDAAKRAELYKNYLANPTKQMRDAATKHAEVMTFQNELGKYGKLAQRVTQTAWPVRFIVPFVRTPVNILKQALGRTPLAPLAKSFWTDVTKGGRARDEALARVTLGTAIAGSVAALAEAGIVTGNGPSDPAERAALLATGWQPQSIKIGGKYYQYGRLEPLAMQIGLAADFATLSKFMDKKQLEEAGTAITLAIAKNLASKTYLQGISDLMEAFSDPDRYGEGYVKKMAASFIPNVLPQTASAIDPILRDTTAETFAGELLNTAKSRVPGLSDNLPSRLDPWGDRITRTGFKTPSEGGAAAVAFNLLSPVRVSQQNVSSPAKTEAAKIMFVAGKPDKFVTINGQKYEIPQDLHRRFAYASGAVAKQQLDQIVKQPWYVGLDDEQKRRVFRKVFEQSRDMYRDAVKYEVYTQLQKAGAAQ